MTMKFSRDLIKGRIAEVVFEQMIRDEKKYDVIPFGYEHTMPSLAQFQHLVMIKQVMENISNAPDFALISKDKTRVYLVEVKYRSHIDNKKLKECAEKLLERWDPSWLFVATPNGFFCAPSSTIARNGDIGKLSASWVSEERQSEYLQLLNEFEKR